MNTQMQGGLPNSTESIARVRDLIKASGISVAEWARVNNFSTGLVYQVLEGRRKCLRGQSYRIAIALGLRRGQAIEVDRLSEVLKAQSLNTYESTQEVKM